MTSKNHVSISWLSAASRTIAVTLGAYAAAALMTMALTLLLTRFGVVRIEAVITASLASLVFYALFAIAAALARTAGHAWLQLGCASLPALGVILLLR